MIIEALEDELVSRLKTVLPIDMAVLTPRQAYAGVAGPVLLVSYRESDYGRDLCLQRRRARFSVQYDAPEEELHLLMQTGLNNIDRYRAQVAMTPASEWQIIADQVDRKDGVLIGIQIYQIDIYG